jgi:ubiquinone/menaquinone biosynthesis C-methylase UbiE
MKRTVTPELLDLDEWAAPEIETALGDLRRINRWFGGTSTMAALLARVARDTGLRRLSFLDVAGASGDVAEGATRQLRKRGIALTATVLDRAASHLKTPLPRVSGDARALPFGDESFDVVGCSLFAHHLSPEQLHAFVEEGLRVCRVAVVINDLRRSALHLAFVYSGFPIYRSRMTRNDGPASVRAAYTEREMVEMLEQTSAARVEAFPHYFFRMGVIAWKR